MLHLAEDSLTYRDIQIRVAELVGYSSYLPTGEATVPADAGRLDRIKRSINDAVREIAVATDGNGQCIRWVWKQVHTTIALVVAGDSPQNIDGDAGRYSLPWWVRSTPTGRATWSLADGMSGVAVAVVDAPSIERDWYSRPQAKGPPVMCGVRPRAFNTDPGQRLGYELLVSPRPDQAYVLHLQFEMGSFSLKGDGDRCPWFPEMDLLLVAWAASLLSPEDESLVERRMRLLMGCMGQNKRMFMSNVAPQDGRRPYVRPISVSVDGVTVL